MRVRCCRVQIKKREEEIASLQTVHSAIKQQLEQRVAGLEAKLAKVGTSFMLWAISSVSPRCQLPAQKHV